MQKTGKLLAIEFLRRCFNSDQTKAFTNRLAAEIDNLNSLIDIPEEQITVLYDVASLIHGNVATLDDGCSYLYRELTSLSMPKPLRQDDSIFVYDFGLILRENENAFAHCTDILNFDLKENDLDFVVQESFPCLKILSVLFRTAQPERCKTVCGIKKNQSLIHTYTAIFDFLSNQRFLNVDAHVAIGKSMKKLDFLMQSTLKDQQMSLNRLKNHLASFHSQPQSIDEDSLESINHTLDRFGLSNIAFNARRSAIDALAGSIDKIILQVGRQIDDTQKLIKNFASLQKRFCVPVDTLRKLVVCGLSVLSGAVTKALTNSNVCGTIVGLVGGMRLAVAAELITFKPGLLSSNDIARKMGCKLTYPTILEYRQENRQKEIDAYLSYFGMPTQKNIFDMS